jgi:hypothetical protein
LLTASLGNKPLHRVATVGRMMPVLAQRKADWS